MAERRRRNPIWWVIALVEFVVLAWIVFTLLTFEPVSAAPVPVSEKAYSSQLECYNAGLYYDQYGTCYSRNPAGLDPVTLQAAIADPVAVAGGPDSGSADGGSNGGSETPGGDAGDAPDAPSAGDGDGGAVNPPADGTSSDDGGTAPDGQPPLTFGPTDPGGPATPGETTDDQPPLTFGPTNPGGPTAPGSDDSDDGPPEPVPPATFGPTDPNGPSDPSGGDSSSGGSGSGSGSGATPPSTAVQVPPRESRTLTLARGFDPKPFVIEMEATGGNVDVGAGLPNCEAYAGSKPDIVLTYTDAEGSVAGIADSPLRIFFEPSSEVDTVIVINDPYGQYWCNDNWKDGATAPMLTIPGGPYGIYDIWIATVTEGESPAGYIVITEEPIVPNT